MNDISNHTVDAIIEEAEPLNKEVVRVVFSTMSPLPKWIPGQYLLWHVSQNGHHAPFSIASRFDEDNPFKIELHVRLNANSEMGKRIAERLNDKQKHTALTLPLGQCHYGRLSPDKPLIILAGSTGYAQACPIFEQTFEDKWSHPVYLFWGNVLPSSFYHLEQLQKWSNHPSHFAYAIASGRKPEHTWNGLEGLVHETALKLVDDHVLKNSQILISGSPTMVYSIFDELTAKGIPKSAFLSDVFDYAPR